MIKRKIKPIELETDAEIEEQAKSIYRENGGNANIPRFDEKRVNANKSDVQREVENIPKTKVNDTPDFLLDENMSEKRVEVIEKLSLLLKRRYSLFVIADILESNNYEQLDEIISQREKLLDMISNYTDNKLKIFTRFKAKVGDKNSSIYAEQEDKMRAVLSNISKGKYFKRRGSPKENLEDVISKIIDSSDFNFACQIETTYINYEIDRVERIIVDLKKRAELDELLAQLGKLERTISDRNNAFNLMNKLISGKSNPEIIIEDKDTEDGR